MLPRGWVLTPEMGVPPLRGPFQTPKIGVGGSVARILQYGSAFGPASGTGQTSKCNQKERQEPENVAISIRTKRAEKKTATHVQAHVVKCRFGVKHRAQFLNRQPHFSTL